MSEETVDTFFETENDLDLGSDPSGGDGASVVSDSVPNNAASGNDVPTDVNQQTQDGGNSEVQKQGFEEQFFDESGNLNLNDAMNFITTNLPQGYDVQDVVTPMRSPVQPVQPPVQQPLGSEPQKEPWEVEYEEKKQAKENHYKPYTTYRDFLVAASGEGYEGNMLLQRADQLANEAAGKEWARLEHKRGFERRAAEDKRLSEERSYSELIPKSRSNLGGAYGKFKTGEDGFNEFIFGSDVKDDTGKVVGKSKGFGTDFINYAFQLQNDGKDVPSDPNSPEFKAFADRWWVQFTSNPKNIQHLMDFSLSKMHLHLQQYTSAALKKKGATEAQRLANATGKGGMSPIQRKQPNLDGGKKADPFGSMLEGADFVDSV